MAGSGTDGPAGVSMSCSRIEYLVGVVQVCRDVEELVGRVGEQRVGAVVLSRADVERDRTEQQVRTGAAAGGACFMVHPAGIWALHGVERKPERAVRGIGAEDGPRRAEIDDNDAVRRATMSAAAVIADLVVEVAVDADAHLIAADVLLVQHLGRGTC